jgi:hypothetical protein
MTFININHHIRLYSCLKYEKTNIENNINKNISDKQKKTSELKNKNTHKNKKYLQRNKNYDRKLFDCKICINCTQGPRPK